MTEKEVIMRVELLENKVKTLQRWNALICLVFAIWNILNLILGAK